MKQHLGDHRFKIGNYGNSSEMMVERTKHWLLLTGDSFYMVFGYIIATVTRYNHSGNHLIVWRKIKCVHMKL
jgi:hypothetical protein